ncbi:MAG: hypothetical protein ACRBB3_05950 [Alphaproteobacteria bacterium]
MSKIRNQFYEAQDFDDLFATLDENPNVLVSYIPLQMTDKLREMVKDLQSQSDEVYINQDIIRTDKIETILEVDNMDSVPYELAEHQGREYLVITEEFNLCHANGKNFNLHTPTMHALMDINSGHMPTMTLQAGMKNKVGEKTHTDKNSIVINLYIEGNGVMFDTDKVKGISLNSPVITAHRGEAHPLCISDEAIAVPHRRHKTEDQPETGRVNIIYAI